MIAVASLLVILALSMLVNHRVGHPVLRHRAGALVPGKVTRAR